MLVSEGVSASRAPKKERYNMFVQNKIALPIPKRRKLEPEASTTFNPIHLNVPNTQRPIDLSEDELTKTIFLTFERGDTDPKLPSTTLSNVSTSQEATTLDPIREVPRSNLSGEVIQLSGNRSSDEPERVFYTQNPSHASERNVGSSLPHLTLPILPLLEGTFRLLIWRFHSLNFVMEGNCLARALQMSQVGSYLQVPRKLSKEKV